MTGGVIRSESYELSGPIAEASLAGLNLDIAFIGVDGIDAKAGCTTHQEIEAHTNGAMIAHARQVIVVADSSKIGKVAFARICEIASVTGLITDRVDGRLPAGPGRGGDQPPGAGLMPAVTAASIVGPARVAGRGVGAFNVIGIEHAEAIVAGAEAAGAPVILQISENCVAYHGGLEPIGRAVLAIAGAATVPAAVHLDHATGTDLVREAARMGFGSVMFDASRLPYAGNVGATREMAAWCHDRGIWLEAELGEIGGKQGAHDPRIRTRPDEAAAYVTETGADALAVTVGSSHAMLTRGAALDLALIGRLRAAVPVPLVLHGSSGVPDDGLVAAVKAGLTKINIATQLNKVFTATVRDHLAGDPAAVDPRRYLGAGREALAREVSRLLEMLGARP